MANTFRNRFAPLAVLDHQRQFPPNPTPVVSSLFTDVDPKLIKTYFKLLQAIHHIEILQDALNKNTPPIGMARKVDFFLTAFIKPAAPDDLVLANIKQNTADWMTRESENFNQTLHRHNI